MFNWAYSKFSRPTIFAYRVKNWIQQFQPHHFQLLKLAHEQHYFALFPRRSVFVCMFCLFICFLAHITHWAISMKEKVFSKQKQKLDFEIRTVKVLIKIHPISSSAACSSKCKTFDSSNCGNNCWCLKEIIIQFLSIPRPTEESSFPRKHVREFEIIELRCSPGVLLRWKWKKHWVMKLKNEYQIASTCLFVKSIRQSKQSSFEHIEIFICIKISRYAQGIPTVIKTACCFREWCYFKLQL